MAKKKNSSLKAVVLLIAPSIFFFSLLFLVMVFVVGVRSFNDLADLKYLIASPLGLMLVSIIGIKSTGITIKKVLIGWLENNLYWLFP